MQLEIVYEDNHLIIVNKPAGILTQQDYSKSLSLMDYVKEYLKEKYNKPGNVYLGMVHRLDRDVSGLVIFARTSKAASRLSEQFRNKNVVKIYLALTLSNKDKEAEKLTLLEQYLTRKRDISIINNKFKQGSKAVSLQYQTIATNEKYAIHLINLISGKKHQIRSQLAYHSLAILGDKKYGSTYLMKQVCLHAYFISFQHPTTKNELSFKVLIPDYMNEKLSLDYTKIKIIDTIINSIKNKQKDTNNND